MGLGESGDAPIGAHGPRPPTAAGVPGGIHGARSAISRAAASRGPAAPELGQGDLGRVLVRARRAPGARRPARRRLGRRRGRRRPGRQAIRGRRVPEQRRHPNHPRPGRPLGRRAGGPRPGPPRFLGRPGRGGLRIGRSRPGDRLALAPGQELLEGLTGPQGEAEGRVRRPARLEQPRPRRGPLRGPHGLPEPLVERPWVIRPEPLGDRLSGLADGPVRRPRAAAGRRGDVQRVAAPRLDVRPLGRPGRHAGRPVPSPRSGDGIPPESGLWRGSSLGSDRVGVAPR